MKSFACLLFACPLHGTAADPKLTLPVDDENVLIVASKWGGTCLTMVGSPNRRVSAVSLEDCEYPRLPSQLWKFDQTSGTICSQGQCLNALDAGGSIGGYVTAHQMFNRSFVFNPTAGTFALESNGNIRLNIQGGDGWNGNYGRDISLWNSGGSLGSANEFWTLLVP